MIAHVIATAAAWTSPGKVMTREHTRHVRESHRNSRESHRRLSIEDDVVARGESRQEPTAPGRREPVSLASSIPPLWRKASQAAIPPMG